ncbi:unnamed protein product [Paramecium pentaurelia]|uniref:Uncharacterized protein n=1 Tax=Paramecium pentaurelia TaxID=43138 RepID=A0A8S1YFY4_9CILI|nr:unnamed protein product [Paramecium pentaurelia]
MIAFFEQTLNMKSKLIVMKRQLDLLLLKKHIKILDMEFQLRFITRSKGNCLYVI